MSNFDAKIIADEFTDMKISEEISEKLRDEIISGKLMPRERLLEEDLAKRFHVSRTPVREAIKRLESAGLVKIEHNKGAFVSDRDVSEIRNIYELRMVLEGYATEAAIPFINIDTVGNLEKTIRKMENCIETNDAMRFGIENETFHRLILDRCPNTIAVKCIYDLWELIGPVRRLSWRTISSMTRSIEEHKQILNDIRNGDRKAAGRHASNHIKLYMNENLAENENEMRRTN